MQIGLGARDGRWAGRCETPSLVFLHPRGAAREMTTVPSSPCPPRKPQRQQLGWFKSSSCTELLPTLAAALGSELKHPRLACQRCRQRPKAKGAANTTVDHGTTPLRWQWGLNNNPRGTSLASLNSKTLCTLRVPRGTPKPPNCTGGKHSACV